MKEEYPMRINKYLATKNYSTRRGADELIKKHRVFINGRPAELGDKVLMEDTVEVRLGKKERKQSYVYLAYNKPKGVVSHSPQRGDKGISDVIPMKDVFPVGRLDKNSHGLIILTNDGRVTDRLLSPKFDHDKEYLVTTKNKLRSSFKGKMESGVRIENEYAAPAKVEIINDHTFKVVLTEGKKHQIRRMCSALFQEVDDLKRIRIMNIELGSLASGKYREIKDGEREKFLSSLGLLNSV